MTDDDLNLGLDAKKISENSQKIKSFGINVIAINVVTINVVSKITL
jgi:hypothetical protein